MKNSKDIKHRSNSEPVNPAYWKKDYWDVGPVFGEPVEGIDDGIKGYAVRGLSSKRGGYGVIGRSDSFGHSFRVGVYGESNLGIGVRLN